MFARIRPLILALLAVLMAMPVFAASHREAPMIANDPTADITDFYFFRSWQNPDKAILIMNVIPAQEPGSGPNYFNFADDVLYEIHIDNNKNNIAANIVYQIRFKTEIRPPGNVFPLSYVAVPGPITALTGGGSEGLLLRQSYTVTEVRYGQSPRDIGSGPMYAVPSNVGPRTMPNYEAAGGQGNLPLEKRRTSLRRSAAMRRSTSTGRNVRYLKPAYLADSFRCQRCERRHHRRGAWLRQRRYLQRLQRQHHRAGNSDRGTHRPERQ